LPTAQRLRCVRRNATDGIERCSAGTKWVGVAEDELVETRQVGLPSFPQAAAF